MGVYLVDDDISNRSVEVFGRLLVSSSEVLVNIRVVFISKSKFHHSFVNSDIRSTFL